MWQTKRKVAAMASANNAMELDIKSAASSSGRSRRKEGKAAADKQLREFCNKLGSSIESLIDATPLGVPDPCDPWIPSTDKKKAMLSNPISVLNSISETIGALPPVKFFNSMGAGGSSWMSAFREGLANAVLAEKALDQNLEGEMTDDGVNVPPVMVEVEVDAVVSSEGAGEDFVDLGADQWNNSPRATNPMEEAVSEVKVIRKAVSHFLNKRCLPFLDNLTLRANGIVVTSDDCSVECSLASLVDDYVEAYSPSSVPEIISSDVDDFEDCSVVTEIAMDEELEDTEDDIEVIDIEVIEVIEVTTGDQVREEEVQEPKTADNCAQDLTIDDQEYVMTEEPDSEDEDFVDVRAELDSTYCP
mmetsp:Transcript_22679/g.49093  ORF Transcript_22679/g.49093 Transcript_22679/m.49093 type:complete len:360 (-) Transcript_22679:506-1585(-)